MFASAMLHRSIVPFPRRGHQALVLRLARTSVFFAVLCLSLTSNSRPAAGQTVRFELGQRVRAMEESWERNRDAERRRVAVVAINQAVMKFFSFQQVAAARLLDEARLTLDGVQAEPQRRWSESISFSPARRLIEGDATEQLEIRVAQFYSVTGEAPTDARIELDLKTDAGVTLARTAHSLATLPVDVRLPLKPPVASSDYLLSAAVVFGGQRIALPTQTVSIVSQLAPRIVKLRTAVAQLEGATATTTGETLREHLRVLDDLAAGKTLETNFPAARMLVAAEELAAIVTEPAAEDARPPGARAPGEIWRVFIGPRQQRCTVRLLAPPAETPETARPLVVALHGSGGSENMFFDAYGAGKIAKLCRDRNWLLVAPRQGLFGGVGMTLDELTDEVDKLHPVDRQRVFVVGHSMGAMQALRMVDQARAKPALVAALGGGGRVSQPASLADTAFVIGVGSLDMGRRGGLQLADQLRRAELPRVELHDYADTDHLTVVQVGLEDVFQRCDAIAK